MRDSFCTPLFNLIESKDRSLDGRIYLKHKEIYPIIQGATRHNHAFFTHFTDAEIASIFSDTRLDLKNLFITSETSRAETLAGHLLLNMEMSSYVTWLPLTAKALNDRYTPKDQAYILKYSQALPGRTGSTIDGRQLLTGRIAPLILQSETHLNAWVDELMKAVRRREKSFWPRRMSADLSVTNEYLQLDDDSDMASLPVLITFAGILDTVMFNKSVSRYVKASLYELTESEYYGLSLNINDDFLRNTLSYGLKIIKNEYLEDYICKQIGPDTIKHKNKHVAAALLASSVNWNREYIQIEQLINIKNNFIHEESVDLLLRNHAMDWSDDWFKKLQSTSHCTALKEEVCTASRFKRWASYSTRWRSMHCFRQLHDWVEMMPLQDKKAVLAHLISCFNRDIKSEAECGIVYCKMLVLAFPQEAAVKEALDNSIELIVKQSIKQKDSELISHLLENNKLSGRDVARFIRTLEDYNGLAIKSKDRLLLPFIRNAIKSDLLSDSLGL